MPVGAISSTNTMSFQEKLRQPQARTRTDKPIASTTIGNNKNTDDNFKYKVGGAIAGTIGTGVLLAKTHDAKILTKAVGEDLSLVDKVLNPVKGAISTTGKFIDETATKVWTTVKGVFTKNEDKADDVVKKADDSAVSATEGEVSEVVAAEEKDLKTVDIEAEIK